MVHGGLGRALQLNETMASGVGISQLRETPKNILMP
jgi:hypothetical protein